MRNIITKDSITRRVIGYEILGFLTVIVFLWVNELFDIPHHLFGTEATPINWMESLIESTFLIALCVFIVVFSNRFLQRISYLEGFFRICSFCKKVNINDEWIPLDHFVANHSAASFSHGYCRECVKKHYGIVLKKKEEEGRSDQ